MANFLLGAVATWLFCLPLTVVAIALFLAARSSRNGRGDHRKGPDA